MRGAKPSVTALALAATLMTGPLFADTAPTPASPEPAATPAPADPSAETHLQLRPTQPLALETTPSSPGAAWKLGAFVLIAAGGFWAWKRRAKTSPATELAQLRVIRRTTIGMRSELLLLELDGQRLLIGVTPSSMQTLYLLPDTSHDETSAEAPALELRRDAASERRISNLLESRLAPREETREPARAPSATQAVEDDSIFEGQASGLRNLGARR